MTSNFRLYPEEHRSRWWSLTDYQAVLDAMKKTGAKRVLEFGPGGSTRALIEGGAITVDTCEDNADWAGVYEERLVKAFPDVVRLHRYDWPEGKKLSIPAVSKGPKYDLCLIDGPRETHRRPDVVRFALSRATWILVPCECNETAGLGAQIDEIAEQAGRPVEFTTTGPLAGGFALIGPKPKFAEVPGL